MNIEKTFINQFSNHFIEINRELKRTLNNRIPLIQNIAEYTVLGEGKRIRPLLFVLSSHLCGYERADVYRLSTIFEFIHAASLLHDDVLDNAELRRKKPSARQKWGNPAAVLGGDYLYTKASSIAIERQNFDILRVLNERTEQMVEGQFLELEQTHNWHIGKDEYLRIIIAKTGTLMSAACACGAAIAGASDEVMENLSGFGLNLGIAFQLIDDLLDYTSCQDTFGKPVGKDLREGKITLPLIYLLPDLDKAEVDRLEYLFKSSKASDRDLERIIRMVRNNGIIGRIRSEAEVYVQKASNYLEYFPESQNKEDLMGLNIAMIERDF